MKIEKKNYNYDFLKISDFISDEEFNHLIPYIDSISKHGKWNMIENNIGPFHNVYSKIISLINEETVKNFLNLPDEYDVKIFIQKMYKNRINSIYQITNNYYGLILLNITPFFRNCNFISVIDNDLNELETIGDGIILKGNDLVNLYKFVNNEEIDIIYLSVKISNKSEADLEDKKNKNLLSFNINDITNGVLIYKNKFSIHSKFKCGSSTLKNWYQKNQHKGRWIDNIRENNGMDLEYLDNVEKNYFVIRNPYERFFSGILQNKIYGIYDIYDYRRGKNYEQYTVPFTNLTENEIIKSLQLSILYNSSILLDKHLKSYLKTYYYTVNSILAEKTCIIELENLNTLLSNISLQEGFDSNIERIDMRGNLFKNINKNEIIKNFYTILNKNSNIVEIKLILNSLEEEYEYFNKLKLWT